MADDPERADPEGTLDTVPPPRGCNDAYSAPTRVGTLPEQVLEAMRLRETDALLEKRTKSGMRAAAGARAVRPPLPARPPSPSPSAPSVPTPEPMQIATLASPASRSDTIVRAAPVLAMFVALGALIAAAISLAGH